jgi:anti-sigma B factor antagonist
MALLRVEEQEGTLTVHFTDTKILDDGTIVATGKELMEALDRASANKRMVLDFGTVQFMSSAMIGKLVLLNKKAKAGLVDLRFRNITSNVYEVFKLTRLNKIFNIEVSSTESA